VAPFVPLLLLETLRDMDRPEEVLEGEDLTTSMPRRFGLNDVVYMQIHRFREALRRGRPQTASEVENLIRLVIRRPDAEEIFEEAGRRVAGHAWEQRAGMYRRTVRVLPRALALRSAQRALRRLFRQVEDGARTRVSRGPLAVRVSDPLTVGGDPGGAACTFYTGMIAETVQRYTGRDVRPEHPHCQARGAAQCEWTVAPA
jgi:predicted hydrocarbon binding protein